MKKAIKIIGVAVLVVVLLLIISPFLFKGKFEDLLKKTINNNLNAQVEWESMDMTLFRSFPDATVIINNFTVLNEAPFAGDTLMYGRRLQLEMNIKQLFKNASEEPIKIDALTLDETSLNIYVDTDENANYDIVKEQNRDSLSTPFVFDLERYTINNSNISYRDVTTKTVLELTGLNHTGSGDFSAVTSELDTETMAQISLDYNDINYLDKQDLKLDAVFLMDLEEKRYTFKENVGFINELPLEFNGFVKLIEEGTQMELTFKTPDSDFKNFLAVIPKGYRSSLDGVQTSGDFRVSGSIIGESTDQTIPNLDIAITSNNASFKFPDLPKRVSNINIDVKVVNETGITEDTYVQINDVRFKIDEDNFKANGTIKNLTENMLVSLNLVGSINLANVEKAYPLKLNNPIKGRLVTDMNTSFDMNSIDKQRYQNIKSTGSASLTDFEYTSVNLPNAISVSKAAITFNTETINLNSFIAKSGGTDINATGTIENLIPFLITDKPLKGRFNVTSNVFNLNDFAVNNSSSKKTTSSDNSKGIEIPDFLDAAITFKANKVIYDNLDLTNASGSLSIVNEQANIRDIKFGIFGGTAGISGNVNSRAGTPTFDMNLNLQKVDIEKSFRGLDMLKNIAPIAQALQGAINTTVNLKGQLDGSLSPLLNTVTGDAFAQLLTAKVNPEQMSLLNILDSKLDFIDLQSINLDNLKTNLSFSNGDVTVKPFDFDVKGITVNASGSHSFSNEMKYMLDLDVPAKYFGSDMGSLLSKLTAQEQERISVTLPVALSGKFSSPKVAINSQAAISNLTAQIVEIQKQRAKDKAGDKIKDILGDIIKNKPNTPTDSTTTGNTGTQTPSTNTNGVIKDVAKDILGGLFGKKKPETQTKKDTVN